MPRPRNTYDANELTRLQERMSAKNCRNFILELGRALERTQAREAEAAYHFRRNQIIERTPDNNPASECNKGAPEMGKTPWWGWAKTEQGSPSGGSYVMQRGTINGILPFKHFILVEPETAQDTETMLVADFHDIRDMHLDDEMRRGSELGGEGVFEAPKVGQRMLGFYVPRDRADTERPLIVCQGVVVDVKEDYQLCFVEPPAVPE